MSGNTGRGMTVLAAAAHPDDIEFMMAGTLLLLRDAGAEIHMCNLSNGNCGTATHGSEENAALRWLEAKASAKKAGAVMHESISYDLGLYYTEELAQKTGAIIRRVQPDILLVPSLEDYMEDHQNAARLLITGAFTRAMPNFKTLPDEPLYGKDVALYHALPYGLRDGMRKRIRPGMYVDIASALSLKRGMLACHESQKSFLDTSQGVDAYLDLMESMSAEVGTMSGRFKFAEGWRRHSHFGFADEDFNPLPEILAQACIIDEEYERSLDI